MSDPDLLAFPFTVDEPLPDPEPVGDDNGCCGAGCCGHGDEPAEDDQPAVYAGPLAHQWIVAATIGVTPAVAKHAAFRQSFRTKEAGIRIEALDVYCLACRRSYDDIADQACSALVNNEHLIGGDQSVRAKRLKVERPANAVSVPPDQLPTINRNGTTAYVNG